MITSLYVSNEYLAAIMGSAAKGRVNLKRFAAVPLSPGAVINGVITDERLLSDALAQTKDQLSGALKTVRLVLGSSQIYTKRGIVPKLARKKVLELVAGEFSDVDTGDDDLIYDYALLSDLGPDKGCSALLCAAKKSLVASYVELLNANGMKLAGLTMTHDALRKLVRFLPDTRDGTFVLLDFDGNTLDALLFVNGEFRFSNRTRLIGERGTAESAGEVIRVVSSLVQFNTAERSGHSVENAYILGMRQSEQTLCASIQTSLDLMTKELTDDRQVISAAEGFRLSAYASAVGNLLGEERI